MSILTRLRRVLAALNRRAEGGRIGPAQPNDSVTVALSPGYVPFDGGNTWHETDNFRWHRD